MSIEENKGKVRLKSRWLIGVKGDMKTAGVCNNVVKDRFE